MQSTNNQFLFILLIVCSFQFLHAQTALIPPGTLKINDSLFMDKSPITNNMYQELFYSLDSNNEKAPITLIVSNGSNVDGNWIDMYSKNPKYQFFPKLHITRKQAEYYCKWRTERVQLLWDTNFPENNKMVLYRLPTTIEFEKAEAYFKASKRFKAYEADNPLELKIKKHPKKNYVSYNISEITGDDHYFGENWKSETQIILPNTYTGFRCICEVTTK
ncbi:SUMF1/EgtB/PvdO family nonheme iron enzyme [Bizionia sp.]|uniref:SUMF1/EgtB/PvdO family nonheme iron enzyme n=1 Tax=Bizionia sp. TaxID=1954480 RepID=UPI003A8D8CD0